MDTISLFPEINCKRGHSRIAWVKRCAECAKVHRSKWSSDNAIQAREGRRRWREANREKLRAENARWRKANPEKTKPEYYQQLNAGNPFYHKAAAANYTAREAGLRGKITSKQLEAMHAKGCALCLGPLGDSWELQYKTPGTSNYIDNVWLVCCSK